MKNIIVLLLIATPLFASAQTCPYSWNFDLGVGAIGQDVLSLQKVFNVDPATQIASQGAGSPGNETSYFGVLTKDSAIRFQEKYAIDVLFPFGIRRPTGYVGIHTRDMLNKLCSKTL